MAWVCAAFFAMGAFTGWLIRWVCEVLRDRAAVDRFVRLQAGRPKRFWEKKF